MEEGRLGKEAFNTIKQRHLLGDVINTEPLKETTGKETLPLGNNSGKKKNHMHKGFKRRIIEFSKVFCFVFPP